MSSKARTILVISTLMMLTVGCDSSQRKPAALPQNCVAEAPTSPGAQPSGVRCFPTFREAIAFATDNSVQLPNADTSRYVASQELVVANNSASVVISIDYKDANYSGASFTWTAPTGCGSYSAAAMPSGWNDVISSVATYSGCAVTLYQNGNFGGSTYPIRVNSAVPNLGSFNDQASSEKWCAVYACS